ncbi:hypothetical protein E4T50_15990 [Aureobasidium sp. EXF-12298]|nr:hypothetical protein E4T50_15990 [Aureobasidium sp. EXF-12298]
MDSITHGKKVLPSTERPDPVRRPSLLPAFEPLSSSPGGLPRALKRKFNQDEDDTRKFYPTPMPTSATGILSSSPNRRVPGLQRTASYSSLSERAPLGTVPSVKLPNNGDALLMGRSSNSSDYQLSANRLISRVHVKATYNAPEGPRLLGEMVVQCLGWNGAKVHYQGSVVELAKGESFVSQKPGSQVMIDVQETRVLLAWPQEEKQCPWDLESSVSRENSAAPERIASSPPPVLPRLRSPESPSPNQHDTVNDTFSETFIADPFDLPSSPGPVHVYEDNEPAEADDMPASSTPMPATRLSPEPIDHSTPTPTKASVQQSISTIPSDMPEEALENDEENDPIVHSFGPYGDNLLSRFESFKSTCKEEDRPRIPLKISLKSANQLRTDTQPSQPARNLSPVKNHIINQLAFTRIHSLPISAIYNNLPAEMKGGRNFNEKALSSEELKDLMDRIPCVGEIARSGKDAAGKALEDEFYYVPEIDTDEHRRAAVSIAKPPLRSTRKQHKQYYWKKLRV